MQGDKGWKQKAVPHRTKLLTGEAMTPLGTVTAKAAVSHAIVPAAERTCADVASQSSWHAMRAATELLLSAVEDSAHGARVSGTGL